MRISSLPSVISWLKGPPYADINNIAKLCDNTGVARNGYTISKEVGHKYKKAAYYQSLWNNPCNRRLFIPAGINRNDYFRIPKCRWGYPFSSDRPAAGLPENNSKSKANCRTGRPVTFYYSKRGGGRS